MFFSFVEWCFAPVSPCVFIRLTVGPEYPGAVEILTLVFPLTLCSKVGLYEMPFFFFNL